MGEVINLRSFRRKKRLAERAREAAQNRARFGRTVGQRKQEELETDATVSFLDRHRLDDKKNDEEAF